MEDFMKKILAGLLLFWSIQALAAQEGTETRALLREIRGTVEVKEPGATDWKPGQRGQTLERRTMISTGFKSGALIEIGNSTLNVQPLTRLSLEELAAADKNEQVNLSLRTGRIRANVKPPVGGSLEFTVKSPTATASVRGTVFELNGVELRVAVEMDSLPETPGELRSRYNGNFSGLRPPAPAGPVQKWRIL
jgi:hypothetical protein